MENLKSDDSIHKECLMKEAWATLKQYQRDRSKARVLESSSLEESAEAESKRLDAKLDRIWWGIAVIVIALVGNIFFMIFRGP